MRQIAAEIKVFGSQHRPSVIAGIFILLLAPMGATVDSDRPLQAYVVTVLGALLVAVVILAVFVMMRRSASKH